jgi:PHP family Zn ribbon phosphoesterase
MAVPKYALSIPPRARVRFLCKTRCRATRYGLRDAARGSVTCGKCGGVQYDASNWSQQQRYN